MSARPSVVAEHLLKFLYNSQSRTNQLQRQGMDFNHSLSLPAGLVTGSAQCLLGSSDYAVELQNCWKSYDCLVQMYKQRLLSRRSGEEKVCECEGTWQQENTLALHLNIAQHVV